MWLRAGAPRTSAEHALAMRRHQLFDDASPRHHAEVENVCVCVCARARVCVYVCARVCGDTCSCEFTCVRARACVCVWLSAHAYGSLYRDHHGELCVHTLMRARVGVHVHVCARTCTCATVVRCVHACARVRRGGRRDCRPLRPRGTAERCAPPLPPPHRPLR